MDTHIKRKNSEQETERTQQKKQKEEYLFNDYIILAKKYHKKILDKKKEIWDKNTTIIEEQLQKQFQIIQEKQRKIQNHQVNWFHNTCKTVELYQFSFPQDLTLPPFTIYMFLKNNLHISSKLTMSFLNSNPQYNYKNHEIFDKILLKLIENNIINFEKVLKVLADVWKCDQSQLFKKLKKIIKNNNKNYSIITNYWSFNKTYKEIFCKTCFLFDCQIHFSQKAENSCFCNGKCKDNCPCKQIEHKCDPNICECNSKNLENCGNFQLFLKTPYTAIAISSIKEAGYGLFALEKIKRNAIIGEYTGELLIKGEIEQRENFFIENNLISYLFELSNENCIDSKWMGNKTRFINHKEHTTNVCVQEYTIGQETKLMFVAKKLIKCGEELFFDYGKHYNI